MKKNNMIYDRIKTKIHIGAKVKIIANLDDHQGYSGEDLIVVSADEDDYFHVANKEGAEWFVGLEELNHVK